MAIKKRTKLSTEGAAGHNEFGAILSSRRRELRLTLQRVADMAGCAKSYLWMIENGERAAPDSEELIMRLERALGLKDGELRDAARWQRTPREVREELEEKRHIAAALRTGLDQAWRSGELAEIARRMERETQSRSAGLSAETTRVGGVRKRRGLAEVLGLGESSKLNEHSAHEEREAGRSPDRQVANPRTGEVGWRVKDLLPREVPLINKVAAGYPAEFTDLGYPAGIASEYVRGLAHSDPDAFACRVVGDSMEPDYHEGDIVVFSPLREIKSGMDCFARIEPDHESTFKRTYIERDESGREMIRLQPLNPKYKARVLPREEVAGLFAAVSVTREINTTGRNI